MHKKLFVLIVSLMAVFDTFCHPNMYFAQPYQFGTRFERKGLVTVDAWATYGDTNHGRNGDTTKTNILNIYGLEQMHQLGKGVAGQGLTTQNADILNTLWRHTPTTNDPNYGALQFTGKCIAINGGLTMAINITDEFFVGGQVPYYKLSMSEPTFVDKTPDAHKDAEWNQFYASFDSILSDVGLSRLGIKKAGIGDVTVFAGWARSTDELDRLDFLDACIRGGVLLGTASAKNEDYAFSIAPGYDKHNGVFFAFDMAFGFAEHYSFGFHLGELFLLQKTKNMRVKTALGQNGFIKLAKTDVNRDMGNIYDVAGHFKMDYKEASLYVGYTYAHQGATVLTAKNSTLYPGSILNTDELAKGWSMHTIHVGVEVDFADDEKRHLHPRLGIGYNHVIRARRAFSNNTTSGSLGISLTWDV